MVFNMRDAAVNSLGLAGATGVVAEGWLAASPKLKETWRLIRGKG